MKRLDVVKPRIPISSLPYTITQGGSYYVTGNLSAGVWDGIFVDASDVTIDLNWYTLSTDSGYCGLYVAAGRTNVSVRDGGVRGFYVALYAESDSNVSVSGLSAIANAMGPILYGSGTIRDSIAANNQYYGFILGGTGAIIRNSRAQSNGFTGLSAPGPGTLVESCTVSRNGASGNTPEERAGIFVGQASRVVGCTTQDNAGSGIAFGDRNLIAENNLFRNGGNVAPVEVGTISNLASNVVF